MRRLCAAGAAGVYALLGIVAAALPVAAQAVAQRTFVASHGQDTNAATNCGIATPCRGFAAAIGVTSPGGEIVVLDSAGYGPVVVNQSVSIVAPSGVYAGISVFSGTGVTVSGAGIVVKLTGLTVIGLGGNTGINFIAGDTMIVDRCTVSGMSQTGINIQANGVRAVITDTRVERNGNYGISVWNGATVDIDRLVAIGHVSSFGNAVLVDTNVAGTTTTVRVSRSTFSLNTSAISAQHEVGSGLVRVSAIDNVISSDPAAAGYGITTQCNGACGVVNQIEVSASGNSLSSLQDSALATFSTNANLVASGNRVFRNGFGLLQSQGILYTLQNNTVELNGSDVSGVATPKSVR